jgi:hypothetical protein
MTAIAAMLPFWCEGREQTGRSRTRRRIQSDLLNPVIDNPLLLRDDRPFGDPVAGDCA